MRAITVEPLKGLAQLEEVAEPDVRDGSVLAAGISVGVCGSPRGAREHMRMPIGFAHLLYTLRIHINLVRARLQQSAQEDLPRDGSEMSA